MILKGFFYKVTFLDLIWFERRICQITERMRTFFETPVRSGGRTREGAVVVNFFVLLNRFIYYWGLVVANLFGKKQTNKKRKKTEKKNYKKKENKKQKNIEKCYQKHRKINRTETQPSNTELKQRIQESKKPTTCYDWWRDSC